MTCSIRSAIGLALTLAAFPVLPALADEGGGSFWLPGQYGSYAAVAPSVGWTMPLGFYSYGGAAGRSIVLTRGRLFAAGLNTKYDALFIEPTYTPDVTILGARPSFSIAFAPSYNAASADVIMGGTSSPSSASLLGGSDLYPTGHLYWNAGLHNFMIYFAGDIPIGSYNPNRLANTGMGHGAIDGGGAYTFSNTATRTELSATLGFTKNFENTATNYTNGIDSHLDVAASQYLTERFYVGAVGYYYQQLTADKGQSAILGPMESRTRAVGPQIGYDFDFGGVVFSTNLRGYIEFDAYRRVQGHAIYAVVNVPLSALFKARSQ